MAQNPSFAPQLLQKPLCTFGLAQKDPTPNRSIHLPSPEQTSQLDAAFPHRVLPPNVCQQKQNLLPHLVASVPSAQKLSPASQVSLRERQYCVLGLWQKLPLGQHCAAAPPATGTTARLRLLPPQRSSESSGQEQAQHPSPGRASRQPAHDSIELPGIHGASPQN